MHSQDRRIPESQPSASSTKAPLRAWLTIVSGSGTDSEFELNQERTVVGCGPAADLVFEDRTMTSARALFERADGHFVVHDLSARGDLRLNGTRVRSAELKSGDVLQIGDHTFEFLAEEGNSLVHEDPA